MAGLEFEQQAFVELLSEDGLIILARSFLVLPACGILFNVISLQGAGLGQAVFEVPQVAL